MELKTLTIVFDDVIEATTATLSGETVILQNAATATNAFVVLTDSTISSPNSRELLITLSNTDADTIKQNLDIGTTVANTFIRTKSNLVQDQLGRFVNPAANTEAFQATAVKIDTIAPNALRWSIDANTGKLYIWLDEAVDLTTVDVTKFVFTIGGETLRLSLPSAVIQG
jgi:hypothetical protein